MQIEKLELNKNITIYRLKYNWLISKNDILKKVIKNCVLNNKIENTYNITLKCKEFNEITKIGIDICKSLTNLIDEDYVSTNFIYLQRNDTKHNTIKEYHTHAYTTFNDKFVLNDWTYCFYLQIPKHIKDNEGKLAFKDKNDNIVYYLPEDGDFIIFKANLQHAPEATIDAECDRVAIIGTASFNVNEKIKLSNKNVI